MGFAFPQRIAKGPGGPHTSAHGHPCSDTRFALCVTKQGSDSPAFPSPSPEMFAGIPQRDAGSLAALHPAAGTQPGMWHRSTSVPLCVEPQGEGSFLGLSSMTGGYGKVSVNSLGPLTPAGNDTVVL